MNDESSYGPSATDAVSPPVIGEDKNHIQPAAAPQAESEQLGQERVSPPVIGAEHPGAEAGSPQSEAADGQAANYDSVDVEQSAAETPAEQTFAGEVQIDESGRAHAAYPGLESATADATPATPIDLPAPEAKEASEDFSRHTYTETDAAGTVAPPVIGELPVDHSNAEQTPEEQ